MNAPDITRAPLLRESSVAACIDRAMHDCDKRVAAICYVMDVLPDTLHPVDLQALLGAVGKLIKRSHNLRTVAPHIDLDIGYSVLALDERIAMEAEGGDYIERRAA